MFEKPQTSVTNTKSINDEENENEADFDKDRLLNKKNAHYPKLSLLEALKIKDLYIITFILTFSGFSIGVFSGQYKVS